MPGDPRVALRAAITPVLSTARRRRAAGAATARFDPHRLFFTTEDLAALADVDWSTADAMLRTLTSSHLVRPARDGRFVTHDLIRLYAAEQSSTEDTADQRAEALGRLFHGYLATPTRWHGATTPGWRSSPDPPTRSGARRWPRNPRRRAGSTPSTPICSARSGTWRSTAPREISWHLADRMRGYLQETGAHGEWREVVELGLAQAQREGDDPGWPR